MRIQHDRIVKPSPDGLELFMARSGRLSARINRNGSYLHLHSAIRPEAEADHFAGIEFWGDLVVFLGMGLGYHVAPYLKDIPSGTRILVIDYHPRCIGHCCEKLFGSASQDIIAVSNTTPDLERVLRDASATARYIQVIRHPASYHAHRDFYEAALESIRFKRVRASEAGGPLLFSGSFFLEQEIERALASRGRPPRFSVIRNWMMPSVSNRRS